MNLSLDALIGHKHWVSADATVGHAHAQFLNHGQEYMAVLDQGCPTGLCSRRDLSLLLGSQYGFALFARKAIQLHLRPRPMHIVEDTDIHAIFDQVFTRDAATFYDDVVVVDRFGRFKGLIHTYTLVKLQNQFQQESIRQLACANSAKSQFVAHMSHEIRTPMNAILGFTQLMQQLELPTDQRELVHKISRAGETLLKIINDILDFSKIEAGQLYIDPQPFKASQVFDRVDDLMRHTANGKGLELRFSGATAIKQVLKGDAMRLEQMLVNLIGNAIKFTERGGVAVSVLTSASDDLRVTLRFEIEDSGMGIAQEALARLFQPFTQADSSITRRFGGTGLGLAISRRLVELMGGQLGATSRVGVGTTFWLEIPFERTAIADLPVAEAPIEEPGEPIVPLRGLRILAVDDNRTNLVLIELALRREGVTVTTAANGQEALQWLDEHPHDFDAVLMDIQMPVMDGLTATRQIRRVPTLARLPIIALSAGVMAEEREAANAAGVNDFISKPLNLGQLVLALSRHVPRALAPDPRQSAVA